MEDRHRPHLDALIAAMTTPAGHLSRDVRKSLVGGKTMSGALGSFAIKVAQNPSSINDEHIQALVKAGHSEDAIFECILAAALGAGLERLDAGLAALKEAGDALNKLRSGHSLKYWLMLKLSPLVAGAPAPDILRILWYRSEFFGKPAGPLQQAVMRGPSDWTTGEREVFAAFISAKNACRFCLDAHTAVASKLIGDEVVDAVLADVDRAAISEKARVTLHFLEKLTVAPDSVRGDDIATLRAAGVSDQAIVDAIYVCMIFCTFNRMVDAFGCQPPTPKQAAVAAKMLIGSGYNVP